MSPSVCIIVLCYNGVELTLACLASLRRIDYPSAHVLVVDNASGDGTPSIVRERFPEVTVIETGANLGYAEGNNVGLRYALKHGYDYALLLNNDTEVAPDFLTRLIEACERDSKIGVVGPKIYLYDQPHRLYTAGGAIDWRRGSTATIGLNEVDHGQHDKQREVSFINGCCLLARCEAVEQTGLIDARFGMYFEESEWCVRIGRAGWKIVYVPTSVLWHKIQLDRHDTSPRITYYMARNRLLFLRLTRAPVSAWWHALILQDGLYLAELGAAAKMARAGNATCSHHSGVSRLSARPFRHGEPPISLQASAEVPSSSDNQVCEGKTARLRALLR